jgi:transposase-like protein
MEGHLLMSQKEWERTRVMQQVQAGRLTLQKASELLGVSYRQAIRIGIRFKAEGGKGLVHRSRGRRSNRRYCEAFRNKVLNRYVARYQPFELGPTLLAEKLAQDGLVVDHETLRRWLLAAGHWSKRRKRAAHRQRRTRRSHFGELVQMDGSHHHWFGAAHAKACLMQLVDDATGTTLALLAEEETTEAAMQLTWQWIERYGVPQALYTDKKNVYVTDREPTLEEQLAGEEPLTTFGKACKRLGIEIIPANSPQAKGRVERKHGVLQDRFVKELALSGIKTIATANALLEKGFMKTLNEKFCQAPLEPQDFHRPVPASVDLVDVFCFEEERVLANDWTVRYQNRYYQITRDNKPLPKPKDKILMRRRLNGELVLLYHGRPLEFETLTPRQYKKNAPKPSPSDAKKNRTNYPKNTRPRRPNCDRLFADSGAE